MRLLRSLYAPSNGPYKPPAPPSSPPKSLALPVNILPDKRHLTIMSMLQANHNIHAYQVIELSDDDDDDEDEFSVGPHDLGGPQFGSAPVQIPDDQLIEDDDDAIDVAGHAARKGKSRQLLDDDIEQDDAFELDDYLAVFNDLRPRLSAPLDENVHSASRKVSGPSIEPRREPDVVNPAGARGSKLNGTFMDEDADDFPFFFDDQILHSHHINKALIPPKANIQDNQRTPLINGQNADRQSQQPALSEIQLLDVIMADDDDHPNLVSDVARTKAKDQAKTAAISTVTDLFPEICPDFVNTLWDDIVHGGDAEVFIAGVLERMDKDKTYPKKQKKQSLKRKREDDEEQELSHKFEHIGRTGYAMGVTYAIAVRNILSDEFPRTPVSHIDKVLAANRGLLFPTYRLLEEHERTLDEVNANPYRKLKKARKVSLQYAPINLAANIAASSCPHSKTAMEELVASRKVKARADSIRQRERQKQLEEEENIRRAERDGTIKECGCCFCEHPLNRMIHCNNELEFHWFCRDCARQTAENEIGNGKYIVACMSMDGCEAGFSQDQREIFLEAKSILALERNEQEAMLRMAGIENLASCPFCPYAAEYPPVEENKEFRCEAPDCQKVSCRLCKLESHTPLSCEENAKENGISARRLVEEAMSAALIRKCNKCGTPFIKEEGCNKMMCTSGGCRNIQCYICSKSCNYDHFNDTTRGGKEGNCPLFGDVRALHEDEVNRAERKALDKVRAEHPELAEEDLKVKVSDKVLKDEAARNRGYVHRYVPPPRGPHAAAVAAAAQYQRHQAVRAARALDNARAHAVNPMQNFNFEEFMREAQLANQRRNAEQRALIDGLRHPLDLDGPNFAWPYEGVRRGVPPMREPPQNQPYHGQWHDAGAALQGVARPVAEERIPNPGLGHIEANDRELQDLIRYQKLMLQPGAAVQNSMAQAALAPLALADLRRPYVHQPLAIEYYGYMPDDGPAVQRVVDGLKGRPFVHPPRQRVYYGDRPNILPAGPPSGKALKQAVENNHPELDNLQAQLGRAEQRLEDSSSARAVVDRMRNNIQVHAQHLPGLQNIDNMYHRFHDDAERFLRNNMQEADDEAHEIQRLQARIKELRRRVSPAANRNDDDDVQFLFENHNPDLPREYYGQGPVPHALRRHAIPQQDLGQVFVPGLPERIAAQEVERAVGRAQHPPLPSKGDGDNNMHLGLLGINADGEMLVDDAFRVLPDLGMRRQSPDEDIWIPGGGLFKGLD